MGACARPTRLLARSLTRLRSVTQGSWGGAGLKPNKHLVKMAETQKRKREEAVSVRCRRSRFADVAGGQVQSAVGKRKDAKLQNVIITERRDRKVRQRARTRRCACVRWSRLMPPGGPVVRAVCEVPGDQAAAPIQDAGAVRSLPCQPAGCVRGRGHGSTSPHRRAQARTGTPCPPSSRSSSPQLSCRSTACARAPSAPAPSCPSAHWARA